MTQHQIHPSVQIDLSQATNKAYAAVEAMLVHTNTVLELCELAKLYMPDASGVFINRSIVVAVNNSQPIEEQITDIELTIRLLTVLAAKLKEQLP